MPRRGTRPPLDRAWAGQLGPVYRQGDVADLLGKSKQAVSADRRLLKLQMRSGDIGYPVFQFDGRRTLPGVGDVVEVLADAVATPWTTASWLTSPHPDLGDTTPVAALQNGRIQDVVALAHRWAAQLAA
jgi:hypothetical protein